MNIFVTHPSPAVSALWLDDSRLNKMILESAQMLSTAIRTVTDNDASICEGLYRKTHTNHPCNIWVRETRANFMWLVAHASTMANYKATRDGKRHRSMEIIVNALRRSRVIPEGEQTPFANSAANQDHGVDFKSEPNTYSAYRKYLVARWLSDKRMPTWKGDARACPDWALDALREHYGEDNIPELAWDCHDHTGHTIKTQRQQWAEGDGGYAEVYSCVE